MLVIHVGKRVCRNDGIFAAVGSKYIATQHRADMHWRLALWLGGLLWHSPVI